MGRSDVMPPRYASRAARVVEEVCAWFDLPLDQLYTPLRSKVGTEARLYCVGLLSDELDMSDARIGELLGRQRTTVLHYRRLFHERKHTREMQWHVAQLRARLRDAGIVADDKTENEKNTKGKTDGRARNA